MEEFKKLFEERKKEFPQELIDRFELLFKDLRIINIKSYLDKDFSEERIFYKNDYISTEEAIKLLKNE